MSVQNLYRIIKPIGTSMEIENVLIPIISVCLTEKEDRRFQSDVTKTVRFMKFCFF